MSSRPGLRTLRARLRMFVAALEEGDEVVVEQVLALSRSRRLFAPLAYSVGAFAMLLRGLRTLLANWRLMLIQVVPAVWLWLAMYDLKIHVLHGHSFNVLRGPVLIPIALLIVAITITGFFLNAVFAFAVAESRRPKIRPAFARARLELVPIAIVGTFVGVLLALATTIVTRYGKPWFGLSLSVVIGIMMVTYVGLPARLIGIRATMSRRDKLTASAIGTTLGALVCTPPYLLGRLGLLMLGSSVLAIPGFVILTTGVMMQAGATGAVRAIRMSSVLGAGAADPDSV